MPCIMHCINLLHMTLYLLLPPSDIHMNYTHNYLHSHTIVQHKWGLTLLNQVNWEWQAAWVWDSGAEWVWDQYQGGTAYMHAHG